MTAEARSADSDSLTYTRLLDLIAGGVYEAGTWLREQAVAERLGVSRTPVREALVRLGAEGIVEMHPGRGARVVEWSDTAIQEAIVVRAELESMAVRSATGRIDADTLARLHRLQEEMTRIAQAETGLEDIVELNTDFHLTLVRAGGNGYLTGVVDSCLRSAFSARTFRQFSREGLRRQMGHHDELLAALHDGDAEWAASVMRAHILAGRQAHREA